MAAGKDDRMISELAQKTSKLQVKSPTLMHPKVPAGTRHVSRLDIATNVWGVFPNVNNPIYRYDFRILAEFPPKKGTNCPAMKEITKQTRDDCVLIERKAKCVAIYMYLVERERDTFPEVTKMVYDRAALLFSMEKLKLKPKEGGDAGETFVVTQKEAEALNEQHPQLFVENDCIAYHISVKPCDDRSSLTMNDISRCCSSNLDDIDHSLLQYFDTLLLQEVYFNGRQFISYGPGDCYLLDPEQFHFSENDIPRLGEGKYIGIGASKGMHVIEGHQKLSACAFIDVQKAAFHCDHQLLHEKMAELFRTDVRSLNEQEPNLSVLNKGLKGLRVRCDYGTSKSFVISQISSETAKTHMVSSQSGKVSVQQYYHTKHHINLLFPNLPLVCERTPKGVNCYPPELLRVCENQRVSQLQQSSDQVQQMIKRCAISPYNRYEQTLKMVRAMNLHLGGSNNAWLKGAGVRMTEANLTFCARVLPTPTIQFSGNQFAKVDPNRVNWMGGKLQYIKPARCKAWYAVAFIVSNQLSESAFRQYIDAFCRQCWKRGMNMGQLVACEYVNRPKEQDLDFHIKKAVQKGAQFIHCITSDKLNFHGRMKYLEVAEQILTQDLKASTASNAPKKIQTMENIVNKTNVKLGGFNYYVSLERKNEQWLSRTDRLIIGLDVAHPPVANMKVRDADDRRRWSSIPSIIGYSANTRKDPMEFVGGYCYAEADMEEMKDYSLCTVIEKLLADTVKERQKLPAHIIIFRDGISEGQYKYVINFEVEQVKKACKKIACSPQITYIIVTKRHNLRLYRKLIDKSARPADQNISPGVVVDQHVVNPVYTEYYLNSHAALQGTTRCPRYTIVYDTSHMSSDESQGIAHALAFNFQIVNSAVSRPAPVMIATEMAKRGRANYISLFSDRAHGAGGDNAGEIPEVNTHLGYQGKPLSAVRFNA